jgi:hypothetical protein
LGDQVASLLEFEARRSGRVSGLPQAVHAAADEGADMIEREDPVEQAAQTFEGIGVVGFVDCVRSDANCS